MSLDSQAFLESNPQTLPSLQFSVQSRSMLKRSRFQAKLKPKQKKSQMQFCKSAKQFHIIIVLILLQVSPLRLHGLKLDLPSGEASCEGKGKGPETCSGRYLARLSYSYLLHNTLRVMDQLSCSHTKKKKICCCSSICFQRYQMHPSLFAFSIYLRKYSKEFQASQKQEQHCIYRGAYETVTGLQIQQPFKAACNIPHTSIKGQFLTLFINLLRAHK